MIVSRSGMYKIGWAMILTVCGAMLLALTFKVNAVKSQVRLTERQIVAARQEKALLETEFETRASQHHLAALNNVEFGYTAPTPQQYLSGERSLAALGKPQSVGAPTPILVATAEDSPKSAQPEMVNPLSGKAMAAEVRHPEAARPTAATLSSRLAHVDRIPTLIRGAERE